MKYKGERIYLSEFTREDFDLFYSVFSNDQVMKYALIDKYTSREDILPYFEEVLENNSSKEDRKAYEFAVYLNTNGHFIGFAGIEIYKKNTSGGCGEIGYFLLPQHWGNGYATEISKLLIAISFKEIKLHGVAARCNANNLKSEKVMQKLGMTKEGEFRKVRFKDNQWVNEQEYCILVEEWKQDN